MPSSVDLGNQLENFIAELLKSERYNTKSEAIREGVRLLQKLGSLLWMPPLPEVSPMVTQAASSL